MPPKKIIQMKQMHIPTTFDPPIPIWSAPPIPMSFDPLFMGKMLITFR